MRVRYTVTTLKDSWLVVFFLIAASLAIAFLVAKVNLIVSPVIIALVLGIGFAAIVFRDYRIGFYGGFVLASIMFYFERLVSVSLPYGVLVDLAFFLAFVAIATDPTKQQWRKYVTHPITIAYTLTFVFQLFQVFNPNAVSSTAWLVSLRGILLLLIMFVTTELVSNLNNIKMLVKIWFVVATLAAVYGIYQEIFGLTGFEMNWVTRDPLRYGLYFIMGHMRKFSFLSDPSAFGVFMAASALGAFVMFFAPIPKLKKAALVFLFFSAIVSMLYSGTRTAYAMLVLGIVFFIMITIRRKATFVAAVFLILGFLLLMFGPFYNRSINRFRTAFKPSEDASMEVRDVKRVQLQPYIQRNPMGSGINTSGSTGAKYAPGHWLANWDMDSGYLKVAIEQGWIGLTILMLFLTMVAVKGIDNHFHLVNPMLQSLNLVFLVSFFAVSVAAYTQHALLYKPVYLLVISTFSVVICIRNLDKPSLV